MSGGSPTRWRSGATPDSLTLQPDLSFAVPRSHNSPDGHADIAAHPGVPITDGSGERPSGISNVAHSHQPAIPDDVLGIPEQFDDAPYVPPRIAQAGLQTFPAPDPRVGNYDQHQYPYQGATSPSESHNSVESSWSNSSSSSASSHRLPHDYLAQPTYPHAPPPPRYATYPHHYPAYHGHLRLGLEHVRCGEQPSNIGGSYYRTPPQAYSIDGLLSPEIFDDPSAQVSIPSQVNHPVTSSQASSSPSSSISAANHPPNVSAFSMSPAPLTDSTRSLFPDAGPYLRQQLGLSDHDPISLRSLSDPPSGEKPSTPLPMLVKLAIYGSPNKQLTLQEIYTELESRFQWFRAHKNDRAWKNSIRHNLSLNKVFKHVPRPMTEPGKGSYWQLDISGGEGYKRTRKRRPKSRKLASEEEEEDPSEMEENHPNSVDPSQHAGFTQSSATSVEDAQIDPELRSEGHVVGESRARSTTRRAGRESPYPPQSPRYQQVSLPVVAGQDTSAPGQPCIRFGQPSFGQTFAMYPQTRPIPATSSSSLFAAMTSSSMTNDQTMSTVVRPQLQLRHVVSDDRTAHIPQLPPRPGIEYVVDPGGLPAARRVKTYAESQEQSQGDTTRPSPESSSSGSSRTWNNTRSRC